MQNLSSPVRSLSPRSLFLTALAVIALAETGIMLALHRLLPEETTPLWLHITVDTLALVAICVPLLWHFFLRPLRHAAESESLQARAILETAVDGIIAIDERGTVRTFNHAAETLFGYRAADVIGNNVSMLMPAPHREQHDAYLQRYLQTGQSKIVGHRAELRGMRQDGTLFSMELAVSENRIHGQRLFTAIVHDLAPQKTAEAALLRAHTLLEKIFSNMPGLIAYLDADFRFIRVNAAYAAADGRPVDFFPGKHHFDLYPSDENEALFHRVLRTGEPYIAHARPFTYADHPERGTTYWNWVLQPIRNGGDHIESLLLTLIDVSEQVQAQEALQVKEKHERALLDATAESAFLLGADGTVLTINQTASERFGQSREAMLGQCVWNFMPPDVAAKQKARIAAIMADGTPAHYEDSRDGRYYRTAAYPVPDADGQARHVAIFATDITEQRLLRGADELLHEMDRSLLGGAPLPDVLNKTCARIATLFDLRLAWIGKKLPDGAVGICAGAGPADPYLESLRQQGVRWDNSPQGRGPTGSALRSGSPYLIHVSAGNFQPWREAAERERIRCVCAFPLVLRGEVYGALTVYAEREDVLHDPLANRVLESIVARLDVTMEHWLDQQRLHLLSGALAAAGNAILITDRNGRIEWVNESFSRLTGYSAQEALGQTPRLLKSGKQDAAYYQELWATITGGQVWSHEAVERHKDGSLYTVQQTITPIRDETDQITHFISIQEDISAQKLAEQRIQHMAHHDALTGLPNRLLFNDRLQQAINLAKRNNDHVALLFLDLDRFKPVNDTYGHEVGDRLLQDVARRLLACVRETDTVSRIAGDEFTVVLTTVAGRPDAATVAEKIIKTLGAPFQLGEVTVQIGASIGIALYPDNAHEQEELIRLADDAMYEAKRQSRNTYRFHATS